VTRKELLGANEEDMLLTIRKITGRTEFNFEFRIGKDLWSEGVVDNMEKSQDFAKFVWDCLARHCICDWGDVTQEDKDANDEAFKSDEQLCSTYTHTKYPTIHIVTEADRSETVVGLLGDFEEVED